MNAGLPLQIIEHYTRNSKQYLNSNSSTLKTFEFKILRQYPLYLVYDVPDIFCIA